MNKKQQKAISGYIEHLTDDIGFLKGREWEDTTDLEKSHRRTIISNKENMIKWLNNIASLSDSNESDDIDVIISESGCTCGLQDMAEDDNTITCEKCEMKPERTAVCLSCQKPIGRIHPDQYCSMSCFHEDYDRRTER